jgi:phage terminase small subunit
MAGRAGRSGRRRVSPELHIIRGTFRKDRHALAPVVDPAPPVRLPRPPRGLSVEIRRFWTDTVRHWQIEAPADLKLLQLACEALQDAHEARAERKREGDTLTMPSGARRPHPAVQREHNARLTFARLLAQLNLENSR